MRKAIEAPKSIQYEIFYATSDNKWEIFSIDKAKKILDYKPSDNAGGVIKHNKAKSRKEAA